MRKISRTSELWGFLSAAAVGPTLVPSTGWPDWGGAVLFSISPLHDLLFFLSCLLGSSSSLFFLQKGRKANLEHTQVMSSTTAWLWACLWLLDNEKARVGESQCPPGKGGRRRDAYLLGPLHSSPWRAAGCCSHSLPLGSWASRLCPPLPLTQCPRKLPALRRGKSDQQRSMQEPCGTPRPDEGETAFSSLDRRPLCPAENLVFFLPSSRVGSSWVDVSAGLQYQAVLLNRVLRPS